jgi:hypothetical protein
MKNLKINIYQTLKSKMYHRFHLVEHIYVSSSAMERAGNIYIHMVIGSNIDDILDATFLIEDILDQIKSSIKINAFTKIYNSL